MRHLHPCTTRPENARHVESSYDVPALLEAAARLDDAGTLGARIDPLRGRSAPTGAHLATATEGGWASGSVVVTASRPPGPVHPTQSEPIPHPLGLRHPARAATSWLAPPAPTALLTTSSPLVAAGAPRAAAASVDVTDRGAAATAPRLHAGRA